jgi:succinate dehydrogenase flavoprotein subunit
MGGIAVDARMQTDIPGLFAAGEAVGGANGANRLSGNAMSEAFVFGRRAGRGAAEHAKRESIAADADNLASVIDLTSADSPARDLNTADMISRLQTLMQEWVGPLRSQEKLTHALTEIDRLMADIGSRPPGAASQFNMLRLDWFDLRNMLLVARVVASAALARPETRGAQQRDDFPDVSAEWAQNQLVSLRGGELAMERVPVRALAAEMA